MKAVHQYLKDQKLKLFGIQIPIIPGAIKGANAAAKGNAGLISLGITLSNTFAIGLNIFLKRHSFFYIVNIEASLACKKASV